MTGDQPTKFVESNALLALLDGDEDGATDRVLDMFPGERRRLAEVARALAVLCDDINDEEAN